MADRKSSFPFRFWSSSASASSRRPPATQTTAKQPITTTTSTPTATPKTEPKSATSNPNPNSNPNSNPNPITEPKSATSNTNPNPNPITEPKSATSNTNPIPSLITEPKSATTNPSPNPNPITEPKSATSNTNPNPNPNLITEPKSATSNTNPNPNPITEPKSATSNTNPNPNPITEPKSASSNTNPNPNPNPITKSAKEGEPADLPRTTTAQTANQPTITALTSPNDEPKKSSLPSSVLGSPSRRTSQSRSPPQPSSPSRGPTKAPPSPSRVGPTTPKTLPSTTQKASQRRSPSTSPKVTKSASPSKESKQITQEISSSYEPPQHIASPSKESKQMTKELKADAKSDSANGLNGQTVDERGSNHGKVEVAPFSSKSSEYGTTSTGKLSASTVNGGYHPLVEPNANPEETKDVKEVQQATNIRANEEEKDVGNFLKPKSGSEAQVIEKAVIPSKPEETQMGKQEAVDTKQMLAKPTDNKTSQPKKRSTIVNKSGLPIGDNVPFHKDIRDDISTLVNKMAIGDPKSTVHDRPVSVITLAGENRGASMQMESGSSRKDGPIHIHRGYKINPDESAEAASDAEEKMSGDAKAIEDQPTEAYVNNNAQGINNSIVFNSSITERNPGVHMVVTHVPKEPIRPLEDKSAPETRKSEFNMSRSERLTYEPTIRRRCLRGLLLESSDSDPEKPRRHGCRVSCQQKDKENDIDVL